MTDDWNQDFFSQICSSNGLDNDINHPEHKKIEKLELFFTSFTHITCFSRFTNLTELIIISNPIKRIENLDNCINLISLWICECELDAIEGLEQCGQIRHLYLYDNKIDKIKNLDSLRLLETLWLNDNLISQIDGLNDLLILDELNLSNNFITGIDNRLQNNISLTNLNLSGNPLNDFNDILNLCKLPKLKYLKLNGPESLENTLFYHPNYFLYLFYHLPNLKSLDTYYFEGQSHVKETVMNIVQKKRLFYSMKIESSNRNCSNLKNQLNICSKSFLKSPFRYQIELERIYKMINAVIPNADQFEQKLKEILEKITIINDLSSAVQQEVKYYTKQLISLTNEIKSLYQLELSSCGNFKFELGNERMIWYKLCNELINSRFCKYDELENDKTGMFHKLCIRRVIKLKNYLVERRYNSLKQKIDKITSKNTQKSDETKELTEDYLFLYLEQTNKFENNFITILNELLYSNNSQQPVTLTNSITRASLVTSFNHSKLPNSSVRYGRILMVKSFVKNAKLVDQLPHLFYQNKSHQNTFKTKLPNSTNNHCATSETCNCLTHKFIWHFRDSTLLVPEYLVDFEYLNDDENVNNNKSLLYQTFLTETVHTNEIAKSAELVDCDFDQLNQLKSELSFDSFIQDQTELLKQIKHQTNIDCQKITCLNFTNCQLKHLAGISNCINLEELIAPFNLLISIDEISNCKLRLLDLSHNKIQILDGLNDLLNLKVLYLQNNLLSKSRDEISLLYNHTPNLVELNLRNNQFQKPDSIRLRIIGRLKYLKILNEISVTETELNSALDEIYKSRLSDNILLSYGRTDTVKPRSLLLYNTADIIHVLSENKIPTTISDSAKFTKITSISLNGFGISKLSNLEMLENLRFLSLSDNFISKIEGLENCIHLEELNLDRNTITKLENLSRNVKLKKLSLNENYIVSLINIKQIVNLQSLSVHSNKILSLTGLEDCTNLSELYLGNNFINETAEIYNLKQLSNLVILDLYNNPITQTTKSYRISIIYHLKQLKALDGVIVEQIEINQSKDILGGRLNLDLVREKIRADNYETIIELDFSNCNLKSVDLAPIERVSNMKCINLENNSLTNFSGLIHLKNLKVLCLNNNLIESVLPIVSTKSNKTANSLSIQPISNSKISVNLLTLEVLHLGYNNIKSIGQLGLCDIPSIKALFLQGNDLSIIDGLENLRELRELVADQNRITQISDTSFVNNSKILEIHLDDNRLKVLNGLCGLKSLKRLYLANNKINDMKELESLYTLDSLMDISLFGNSVAKRSFHRQYLIQLLPGLLMIDGIEVNSEEKTRAENSAFFYQQQLQQNQHFDEHSAPHNLHVSTNDSSTNNTVLYTSSLPGLILPSNPSSNNVNSSNKHNLSKKPPKPQQAYFGNKSAQLHVTSNNSTNYFSNAIPTKSLYFYDPHISNNSNNANYDSSSSNSTIPKLYFNRRK